MPVILGANSASGGYEVTNSLRFNSASSDYLSRTPASAGSLTSWTWSGWIKRSTLGVEQSIFFGDSSTTNYGGILFTSSDTLDFLNRPSGGLNARLLTTQVFRDVSAWYHIVAVWNTSSATSGDRLILYVNGVRVANFSTETYPSQNTSSVLNTAIAHEVGAYIQANGGSFGAGFRGYMSDVLFIDGQALTPSSFGETDEDTGIWKPKAYTGTYGTNGFYLDFEDSSNLGNDMSGNNNDFTVNNLTSIDQTTDTPTNNFATGNPLLGQSITWSDGNLTISTGADWESSVSTIAVNKGKWYAEFKFVSGSYCNFGVTDIDDAMKVGDGYAGVSGSSFSIGHDQSNSYYTNGSTIANGNTFTTGDIISIALDMDNGKVHFAKNGTYELSSVPASNTGGLSLPSTNYYQFSHGNYSSSSSANFGNPPYSANAYQDANGFGNFSYSVPSGFYSLNTKNLATFG